MSEAIALQLGSAVFTVLMAPLPQGGASTDREGERPSVKTSTAPDQPSLQELIERLRARDDRALEAFIAHTQNMAYRLAYSILSDHARCEDVLQEVYLTVYQKIDQLQNPAAFRGWFSQILVNRCRQELRGRKLESLDDLPPHREPGEEGMSEKVEQSIDLREALGHLSSLDQAVLTMRGVMDLSYQEIADSLKIPLGTVRSRIFKARQRLLSALSGWGPGKGIQS